MANTKRKNKDAQEETRFRIVDYLKNKRGTQKAGCRDIFCIRKECK
ncbi:MAG: hypothetical protein IPH58_12840 [Sphingobacteriales bacterium]|nr:hypothetical protein [Sphingobacteriales bacterium]